MRQRYASRFDQYNLNLFLHYSIFLFLNFPLPEIDQKILMNGEGVHKLLLYIENAKI